MHNDFLLVGPPGDPAMARGKSLKETLRSIAAHGAFVSRGDDSGTHKRELALWKFSGVDVEALPRREETGQGMGASLDITSERQSYTLTDRGTFLALQPRLDLVSVFDGDPRLLNLYSIYVVNPNRHPGTKAEAARKFADFLLAPLTQARIGAFGLKEFGRSLFVPDAASPSGRPG